MKSTDDLILKVLRETKTIACIGASANPARPSHYVSDFLRNNSYRVIGVNPGLAGQTLFGELVYAALKDIPDDIEIDMLDIFRAPENLPKIVADAIASRPNIRTIWTQLGVVHDDAARVAIDHGYQVIQNRCPKIEIPRLMS